MLNNSKTHYPYEHYGDISVDFGSSYWEALVNKHLDTKKWRAQGFQFKVNNEGKFSFFIWATPIGSSQNEKGKTPVIRIATEITWDEFSKSFVSLTAQAFWGRQTLDKFYEVED